MYREGKKKKKSLLTFVFSLYSYFILGPLWSFFGGVAAKGERIFSLDSFGRAGEFLFGVSAWGGLFVCLIMSKQTTAGALSGSDLHETTTMPLISKLLGLELVEAQKGGEADPSDGGAEGAASSAAEGEITPLVASV